MPITTPVVNPYNPISGSPIEQNPSRGDSGIRLPFEPVNPNDPRISQGSSSAGDVEDLTDAERLENLLPGNSALGYEEIQKYLEDLARTDDNFVDTYLDWIMENYFTNSARQYDYLMSNTSVSRMMEDIKKAGFNPWLALQSNISAASSGASSSAGGVNSSGRALDVSRQNNKDTNTRAGVSSAVGAVGDLLKVIALFIIKFAL